MFKFLFGGSDKNALDIKSVSVDEARSAIMLPGNILIDVREAGEYKRRHAAGAVNHPLSALGEKEYKALGNYKNVYVICQSGGRSMKAAHMLINHGVNAINVLGGTSAWESKNLEME